MADVSRRKWRAWERRALTINLKAQDLMVDMIEALGLEHEVTDYADNTVAATEQVLLCVNRELGSARHAK